MIITETELTEIKGASNTLLSLANDSGTDEYIRDMLSFLGCSIGRIADEIKERVRE